MMNRIKYRKIQSYGIEPGENGKESRIVFNALLELNVGKELIKTFN